MALKPHIPWTLGRDRHLQECFGRGDATARKACECPPACKALCRKVRFRSVNGPRVAPGTRPTRPYSAIPNASTGVWGASKRDPADAVKLTYIFLSTEVRPDARWIMKPSHRLAAERGIALKTFREHCRILTRLGLMLRVPLREVSLDRRSNGYAFCLLDVPEWFTGHVTADEEAEAKEAAEPEDAGDEDADDEADRVPGDDDQPDEGMNATAEDWDPDAAEAYDARMEPQNERLRQRVAAAQRARK